MPLTPEEVKKIAHLARISLSEEEITHYTEQLVNILELVKQMDQADITNVQAITNPIDLHQRLRPDKITEDNQRDLFQSLAPDVKAGLYIVPPVIEGD